VIGTSNRTTLSTDGMIEAMTYDLYFWKSAKEDVLPSGVADSLAEGNAEIVVADPAVSAFHRAAVAAFPDVAQGMLEPELNDPNVDRYAIATMFMGDTSRYNDLVRLALAHGLTIYDPQTDELVRAVPPDPTPRQTPRQPFNVVPMPGATSSPCPHCGAQVLIAGPSTNLGPMPVVQATCPSCGSQLQVMRPPMKS